MMQATRSWKSLRPGVRPAGLSIIFLSMMMVISATPADASDAPTLIKSVETHLHAQDATAVATDLDAIVKEFERTADRRQKDKLLSAVGKVLRSKDTELRSAALDAFETMGDAGAWKYYRSLLGKPFRKGFNRLASQAMDVTRTLKPDQAVGPLLAIMKKSKHLGAIAKAVNTLGAYGKNRKRTKILREIIATTMKEKPGVRGRNQDVVYGPRQTGDEARNRWQALSGPMVSAANELTGHELRSAGEWFTLWREHKRKPAGLFQDSI